MNGVEQCHRIVGLVRLQLADQVQADIGVRDDRFGPFALRFLHPVFAEMSVARRDQRRNLVYGARFRNRDQRDSGGITTCGSAGARDPTVDFGKAGSGGDHGCAIRRCMRRRHPLPTVWLMTDERMPDMFAALARLPRRSGIVFRHHSLAEAARRTLFKAVRAVARRHDHVIVLADTPAKARAWGADGAHHRSSLRSCGVRTVPVHSRRERVIADRSGADLLFVSPVFATRSHPDAKPLGRVGLARLIRGARAPAIALGGMSVRRWRRLGALNLHGWAAIDAFSETESRPHVN
jgi:thiamine-phosphate pyrophosphorylase